MLDNEPQRYTVFSFVLIIFAITTYFAESLILFLETEKPVPFHNRLNLPKGVKCLPPFYLKGSVICNDLLDNQPEAKELFSTLSSVTPKPITNALTKIERAVDVSGPMVEGYSRSDKRALQSLLWSGVTDSSVLPENFLPVSSHMWEPLGSPSPLGVLTVTHPKGCAYFFINCPLEA